MARAVKTVQKTFNRPLLLEELAAVLPASDITMGGFEKTSAREWEPRAATYVVVRSRVNGVTTETTAEPGEIWVDTRNVLTVGEAAALDSALAAHASSGRSVQQIEEDLDDADGTDLLPDWETYDAQTQARKDEMVSKTMRLILRRFHRI